MPLVYQLPNEYTFTWTHNFNKNYALSLLLNACCITRKGRSAVEDLTNADNRKDFE